MHSFKHQTAMEWLLRPGSVLGTVSQGLAKCTRSPWWRTWGSEEPQRMLLGDGRWPRWPPNPGCMDRRHVKEDLLEEVTSDRAETQRGSHGKLKIWERVRLSRF